MLSADRGPVAKNRPTAQPVAIIPPTRSCFPHIDAAALAGPREAAPAPCSGWPGGGPAWHPAPPPGCGRHACAVLKTSRWNARSEGDGGLPAEGSHGPPRALASRPAPAPLRHPNRHRPAGSPVEPARPGRACPAPGGRLDSVNRWLKIALRAPIVPGSRSPKSGPAERRCPLGPRSAAGPAVRRPPSAAAVSPGEGNQALRVASGRLRTAAFFRQLSSDAHKSYTEPSPCDATDASTTGF